MRDYLIDFFNLAYLSLQQPAELPVFLGRMRRVTVHIMILLTLAALSVAVGTFHLRDFYNASFIIFIPLMTGLHIVAALMWSTLASALVDKFLAFRVPERAGKSWSSLAILLLAFLPFIFYAPAAVVAGYLDFTMLFMFLVHVLMMIWSIYTAVKGIQYLYEVHWKTALKAYVQALGIIAVFPGLVLLLFSLEIAQLLG